MLEASHLKVAFTVRIAFHITLKLLGGHQVEGVVVQDSEGSLLGPGVETDHQIKFIAKANLCALRDRPNDGELRLQFVSR